MPRKTIRFSPTGDHMREVSQTDTGKSPCAPCRHWTRQQCAEGLTGFPQIGQLCAHWAREPGSDDLNEGRQGRFLG